MRASLPENIEDVDRMLSEHGFRFVRQRGSHRFYRDAHGRGEMFTVTGGGHKIKRDYVDNLSRRLRRRQEHMRVEREFSDSIATTLAQTERKDTHERQERETKMTAGATTTVAVATRETAMPETKECTRCKRPLPTTAFNKNNLPWIKDGLHPVCKGCQSAQGVESQQKRYAAVVSDEEKWNSMLPSGIMPETLAKVRAAYKPGLRVAVVARAANVSDPTAKRYMAFIEDERAAARMNPVPTQPTPAPTPVVQPTLTPEPMPAPMRVVQMVPATDVVTPAVNPTSAEADAPSASTMDDFLTEWMSSIANSPVPSVFRAEHFTLMGSYDDNERQRMFHLFTDEWRGPGRALPEALAVWAVEWMTREKASTIRGRIQL